MYHQPNKLFQYLAAGKPVVSTALSQIRAFSEENGHVVRLAESVEEFDAQIRAALDGDTTEAIEERMRIAGLYSSEAMAEERIRRINDLIASRR